MSQQVQYLYTCDMEGPDAPELPENMIHHRRFTRDRTDFEIDLCDAHNAVFDQELGPYVEHAYPVGKRPKIYEDVRESDVRKRRATASSTGPTDTRPAGRAGTATKRKRSAGDTRRAAEIRTWAKTRGLKVNERGRIPANIVAEYEAAH